jgi:hypothetical protein
MSKPCMRNKRIDRYPSIKNVICPVKTLKSSVREMRDACISDNSSELCDSRAIVDEQLNFFRPAGSGPEAAWIWSITPQTSAPYAIFWRPVDLSAAECRCATIIIPTLKSAHHVSLVQKGANAPFGEERNRCRFKLCNKVTVIAGSYLVM